MNTYSRHFNRQRVMLASMTALIGALLLASPTRACNIPVFRYALERWDAYPYEALIFYDATIPDALQQALETLETRSVNLSVWLIDISQPDMHAEIVPIWAHEKDHATLPWTVVRYPFPYWNSVKTNTLATGPINAATLWHLADSPLRRKVAEHILNGVSAVWIFIEGNDPKENDAKAEILRQRLDWITSEVVLPDVAMAEVEHGKMASGSPGHVPMRIAFKILRVDRQDPTEQFFIKSLLNIEKDHADFKDKPFVIPVFGQGRALWALIGDGISDQMIDDSCAFMLGACSCTIKDLNPGVDLLIQADWFGGVSNLLTVATEAPSLVGLTSDESPAPGAEQTVSARSSGPSLGKIVAATLGVLLVAVAMISVKALSRKE